jgi:hypothetical protein
MWQRRRENMQGILTDDNGAYVKAAIIKMIKITGSITESEEDAEDKMSTYAETDEQGRFTILGIDPDEEYAVEIHIPKKDPEPAEPLLNQIETMNRCSRFDMGFDPKEKPYLLSNNLW